MRSRHNDLRLDRRRRSIPVLPVVLVLSLAANAYFFLRWEPKSGGRIAEMVETVASEEGEPTPAPAEATPAPDAPAEPVTPEAGPRLVSVTISGPISTAFADAMVDDEEASRLALTAGRLYGWWIDPSSDPRKGDTTAVLFEPNPDDIVDITIHALNYKSQKMGKTFVAYRYQPEGWAHATWFDAEGTEVPARLEPKVIESYEQITALVGDGRGHSGMDFKAPVGTDVLTPWAGTVTRTNWNHRYNGNSIEIRSKEGRLRFLHLEETGVKANQKVTAGQVIGKSGNTGRSFAPHLHYEIADSNGRSRDPLQVHQIARRTVPDAERAAFSAEVERLKERLAAEMPETITPAAEE